MFKNSLLLAPDRRSDYNWSKTWSKVTQNGRFPARTPNKHRAKFDVASFILGGEIRNRTNTQKANKQTVNDISTPCLSAYVDNK